MANLQIWEVYAAGNNRQQVGMLPGGPVQNLTTGTTSVASSALNAATTAIRLLADTDTYFRLTSTGSVASSTSGVKLEANREEYFGVPPSGGYILTAITTA